MSYAGETGEVSGVYRPVAEVPKLDRPTATARFVAPGGVTNGQFGLFQWDMQAGEDWVSATKGDS